MCSQPSGTASLGIKSKDFTQVVRHVMPRKVRGATMKGAKRPFCREATWDLAMVDRAIWRSFVNRTTMAWHHCQLPSCWSLIIGILTDNHHDCSINNGNNPCSSRQWVWMTQIIFDIRDIMAVSTVQIRWQCSGNEIVSQKRNTVGFKQGKYELMQSWSGTLAVHFYLFL